MDKYEYRIKTEQMLKLVDQKDYMTAVKIADSIDWRRVKSVSMLCTVSDIYEHNDRYEDARDILLIAYGRSPIGRMILYRLAELAVKMEDFEEAIECYEEFVQVAPKDSSQYILQYKICRGQGQPLEKQIEILEHYRQVDYREKWAYELAKLYHKAGMPDKCVEICDDLILWFSEGEHVIKAMELKMNYKPLSPMQQKKYDKRNEYLKLSQAVTETLDHMEESDSEPEIVPKKKEDPEEKAFKDIVTKLEAHTYDGEEPDPSTTADIEKILQGHKVDLDDIPIAEEPPRPAGFFGRLFGKKSQVEEDDYDDLNPWAQETEKSEKQEPVAEPEEADQEEMEIEPVKLNVGPYDTMNLQKELARNMAQILESSGGKNTRKPEQTQEMKDVEEALRQLGATADVAEMLKEVIANDEKEADQQRETEPEQEAQKPVHMTEDLTEIFAQQNEADEQPGQEVSPYARPTDEAVLAQQTEVIPPVQRIELPAEPERRVQAEPEMPLEQAFEQYQALRSESSAAQGGMEETLAEDTDGQISLFIPEQPEIEKQITGQLTLDEILAEWEKTKKATEEAIAQAEQKKEAERLRRQETGDIYKRLGDVVPAVPDDVQQLMKELEAELKESGMLDEESSAAELLEAETSMEAGNRVAAEADRENLEDTKEFETVGQLLSTKEFAKPGMTGLAKSVAAGIGLVKPEDLAVPQPESVERIREESADSEVPENIQEESAEPEVPENIQEESAEPEMSENIQEEISETEPVQAEPDPFAETRILEQVQDAAGSEEAEPEEAYSEGDVTEGTRVLNRPEEPAEAVLTQAQKKLFSYFVPVKGMSEQLASVLQADKNCVTRYGTSNTGNILLIGRSGSGKTMLALNLVKAIQRTRRMRTGKVAKISAASLNKKLVKEVLEKLHGGSFIIEGAGELADDTIRDLNKYMDGQTEELLVILEDQRKPLDRLMKAHPEFFEKFTSKIEVPIFINDELVTFGKVYAREQGCKIDDMGILALYTRIDEQQRDDHAVTVAEVKDIIDEAIDHATNSGVKKIVSVFKKKQDDTEVILKEHDFGL